MTSRRPNSVAPNQKRGVWIGAALAGAVAFTIWLGAALSERRAAEAEIPVDGASPSADVTVVTPESEEESSVQRTTLEPAPAEDDRPDDDPPQDEPAREASMWDLVGRVIDGTGLGVEGVMVFASHEGEHSGTILQPTHTGDDGSFVVAGCAPGSSVTVWAIAEGQTVGQKTFVRESDGEIVIRTQLDLPRATLIGRVAGPDGSPPKRARLYASPRNAMHGREHEPDPDTGEFRIEGLVPGDYSVLIRSEYPLWYTNIELPPGATHDLGTISLSRGGVVCVRPAGEIEGWEVVVRDELGTRLGSASPERLCSGSMSAGQHFVVMGGESIAARVYPVSVFDSGESEVAILCERGHPKRIVVRSERGGSDQRALLAVWDSRLDARVRTWMSLVGDGEAAWDGWLGAGSHVAIVRLEDGSEITEPFEVHPTDDPSAVEIALP